MSTTIHGIGKKLERIIEGDRLRVDAGLGALSLDDGIGIGTRVAKMIVPSLTPVLIKAGEEQLEGRREVFVINYSDYDVYIGFDLTVSPERGIPLYAGGERVFTMNRSQNAPLYAYCEHEAELIICEVK